MDRNYAVTERHVFSVSNGDGEPEQDGGETLLLETRLPLHLKGIGGF